MDQQPKPLGDRIAAAMAGHTANVSNGDGTVLCNCGTTVGANPAAWRKHRADTVMAIVRPDLDQRDAEITRLTTELAKYVGHEPTTAEEMAYLKGENDRLHAELEQARAAAFTEAARLLENTGHDDDAVNLLDIVAAGITTHAPAPAAVSGA